MFSHVTLGTDYLKCACRFYEPVMATLGIRQPFTLPATLVFGEAMGMKFFVGAPFDGAPSSSGNGTPHPAAPRRCL